MCVVHKLLQMEPNMHSTETTTVTTHAAAAAPTARVGRRPRPQPKGFIIEVLMQVERTDPMIARHLGCSHVGYMQKVFKRKCDAAKYYNHHNRHMRSLNAHGTYRSDWDANTKLMCIVREYKGVEALTIPKTFFINVD